VGCPGSGRSGGSGSGGGVGSGRSGGSGPGSGVGPVPPRPLSSGVVNVSSLAVRSCTNIRVSG
jgi:hypothetical protein